ncbi:hypothetical protein SDC9_104521 [bioreactor metagenome]|uniref:Uncharacterized protein n=1 Tax=bioreactor metagenome TaxID=1076179 RepID=A0A645AY69_9ZZZZ
MKWTCRGSHPYLLGPQQYEIRKSIVRLLKEGKSNHEIAETLDESEGTLKRPVNI